MDHISTLMNKGWLAAIAAASSTKRTRSNTSRPGFSLTNPKLNYKEGDASSTERICSQILNNLGTLLSGSTISSKTKSDSKSDASEAQLSSVKLSWCSSGDVNVKSLELLRKALENTKISYSDHENRYLQLLWVHLSTLLNFVIASKNGSSLNSLIRCLYLTAQRLLLIRYSGKSICENSVSMNKSFAKVKASLQKISTGDTLLDYQISSVQGQLDVLREDELEKGRVLAIEIALSCLSEVIQNHAPENLASLDVQLLGIMNSLFIAKFWNVGSRVMQILATLASINVQGCIMYLKLARHLTRFDCVWNFESILLIAAASVISRIPEIRSMVLHTFLIPLLSDRSNVIRLASVLAVREVYQKTHKTADGHTARQKLMTRVVDELDPQVLKIILSRRTRDYQKDGVSDIAFLFHPISVEYATIYATRQAGTHHSKEFAT